MIKHLYNALFILLIVSIVIISFWMPYLWMNKQKRKITMENDKSTLLTVPEVARKLRVDGTTVRRWIKDGTLDAVVLPHLNARQAYRIRSETLEALINPPVVTEPQHAHKKQNRRAKTK